MEAKFVKEDRMANQVETDAIVKALEGFADKEYGKEVENFAYHLYGRQDEPYGWYLFGISPIEELYGSDKFADGQAEKFLILGDCLDVLPDYNRVLTLKEVHEFAINEMDGRYAAMEKWGVFQSLSMELKETMADISVDEQGYVWVMTIMADGLNFPEVHKTFDGAVESAINDIKEKFCELEEGEREKYDFDEIKKRLEEDRYWKDENTETSYDIVDCPLCK